MYTDLKKMDREHMKEENLIIEVCSLNVEKDKIVNLLNDQLDWGVVILNVFKNRVNNLFCYNLKKNQLWQDVIFPVKKILSAAYKYNNRKMHLMYLCMIEVKNNFELHGIDYAILKGFSLYERVYKENDEFCRESNDIDFLVKKTDIKRVVNLLQEMGYVQGRYNSVSKKIEKASREELITMRMNTHQLFQFVKIVFNEENEEIINIDINFSIFRGGHEIDPVSTEEILERREIINSRYGCYCVLNTYDMFMQLIFHLYRETEYKELRNAMVNVTIMKFCDIREFYIKMKMENKKIIDYIEKYNMADQTFCVMYLADEIFDSHIFNDILSRITPSKKVKEQCENNIDLFLNQVFI